MCAVLQPRDVPLKNPAVLPQEYLTERHSPDTLRTSRVITNFTGTPIAAALLSDRQHRKTSRFSSVFLLPVLSCKWMENVAKTEKGKTRWLWWSFHSRESRCGHWGCGAWTEWGAVTAVWALSWGAALAQSAPTSAAGPAAVRTEKTKHQFMTLGKPGRSRWCCHHSSEDSSALVSVRRWRQFRSLSSWLTC